MEIKEVEVDCPCCDVRLAVDVRTGRVLRWSPRAQTSPEGKPVVRPEDWDRVSGRVLGRSRAAEDKFDQGLSRERRRSTDLDDLFRRANEGLRDVEDRGGTD
jgi:hypothetical protein